ncbi:hypothetical protein K1X84_10045 [bacterium]|nr:hypothetical protein [bacterium]
MKKKLQDALIELANFKLRVNDFIDTAVYEVVFDIITADTFISGVATKILDSSRISIAEKTILDRPLLDNFYWLSPDGRKVDISKFPQIIEYVAQIEKVRICGKKIVQSEV